MYTSHHKQMATITVYRYAVNTVEYKALRFHLTANHIAQFSVLTRKPGNK